MVEALLILMFVVGVSIFGILTYRTRNRLRAFQRLPSPAPVEVEPTQAPPPPVNVAVFPSRYRSIPWILAGLVLVTLLLFHMPVVYAGSIALIIGLLGGQIEAGIAEGRLIKIESQLADAIDLMVGTLQAGGGLTVALENAGREIHKPLSRYLTEMLGRIRYGDDPQTVIRRLPTLIPLESFRLFATALSVHWEVGGSLAPTLATVGRTVRDRIDISRRIRSLTAQTRVSTVVLLLVTYTLALLMWRRDPVHMAAFFRSSIGQTLIAITLVLQAVGIIWQSALSKLRF